MKKRIELTIPVKHPAAWMAWGFLLLSALLRIWYFSAGEMTPFIFWIQLVLPVTAAGVFLLGMLLGPRWAKPASCVSVLLGVAFFILKATTFAPLHRILCTVLYCAVLLLYFLTVLGYLPTKKLLYPLFGLPLVYHVFVEDTKAYFFAEPPVPVWHWLPEISVLLIMAGLLCLSVAMQTKKR